jgi:hypothetical protein
MFCVVALTMIDGLISAAGVLPCGRFKGGSAIGIADS